MHGPKNWWCRETPRGFIPPLTSVICAVGVTVSTTLTGMALPDGRRAQHHDSPKRTTTTVAPFAHHVGTARTRHLCIWIVGDNSTTRTRHVVPRDVASACVQGLRGPSPSARTTMPGLSSTAYGDRARLSPSDPPDYTVLCVCDSTDCN